LPERSKKRIDEKMIKIKKSFCVLTIIYPKKHRLFTGRCFCFLPMILIDEFIMQKFFRKKTKIFQTYSSAKPPMRFSAHREVLLRG